MWEREKEIYDEEMKIDDEKEPELSWRYRLETLVPPLLRTTKRRKDRKSKRKQI